MRISDTRCPPPREGRGNCRCRTARRGTYMVDLGKMLLGLGVLLVILGGILLLAGTFSGKVPWLGRLPGDIYIQRGTWSVYFPLGTCILISIVLTILFAL